jgi:Terminase-like family.
MTIDPSSSSVMNNLPKDLQNLTPAHQAIVMELERRRNENGCKYFEPNGAQGKLIDLLGRSAPHVGIFSAANGIGKTTAIANVLANIIFGSQNRYFDYPLFRHWPYPKRLRFITDPKLVEEIGPLHSEIKKWWPKGKYQASKSGKSYFSQYKANGFLLDVMSYDQDLKQFEGTTLGGVFFDEPPVRSIWNASLARLRMGGIAMVFMTPLTQAAWFFDEVVPRHAEHIVYGDIEENCKTHGTRGQLEHANIARMVSEMDPEEVEARAHGKAMYLQGLVFKNFDPSIHILDQHFSVPSGAQVWQIVDPHGDKPFACIWGFCDRSGTLFQVDEWPNEDFYKMHGCNLGIQDYKQIFAQKEQGWNVTKRIMDRHFSEVRTVHTRATLREEFAKVGINYEISYHGGVEEVHSGVVKVRDFLAYNPNKPIDTLNRPKYYVSPKCINTIKSFQRWSVDPKTGEYADAFKDYMDTVRYWVMANPRHSDPAPYEPPRRMYG